jgi:hypothetical protein
MKKKLLQKIIFVMLIGGLTFVYDSTESTTSKEQDSYQATSRIDPDPY